MRASINMTISAAPLLLSEHRQSASANIYRTTQRGWPSGGLVSQIIFPDQDRAKRFSPPAKAARQDGPIFSGAIRDCVPASIARDVKYFDITAFDWTSAPLTVAAGNGVSDGYTYDLRGKTLSKSSSMNGKVLFAEGLRSMQIANDRESLSGVNQHARFQRRPVDRTVSLR